MSNRSLVALLLAASMLLASAPTPTGQLDEPIQLTAETTIQSNGVRTAQLLVPRGARLDLTEDPDRPGNTIDITIDGGGDDLVAVAIIPAGDVAGYDVVRLPASESPSSRRIASLGSGCRDCELPAGTYDIIVASDSEVEITLTIDELDEAEDGPRDPVRLKRQLNGAVHNEASVVTTHGDGTVFGGAPHSGAGWVDETSFGSGRGSLQTFYAFWYEGVPKSAVPDGELLVQAGVAVPCSYVDPPASAVLFQPGCPTGGTSGVIQTVAIQGKEISGLTYGWSSGVGGGQLAKGGVVEYAGVRNVGAAGYWVELP